MQTVRIQKGSVSPFDERKLLLSFGQIAVGSHDHKLKRITRESSGFQMKGAPLAVASRPNYHSIHVSRVTEIPLELNPGITPHDPRVFCGDRKRYGPKRPSALPLLKLFPSQIEEKSLSKQSISNDILKPMSNHSLRNSLVESNAITNSHTSQLVTVQMLDSSNTAEIALHGEEEIRVKGPLPSNPRFALMVTEIVDKRVQISKEKKNKTLLERGRGDETSVLTNGANIQRRISNNTKKIEVSVVVNGVDKNDANEASKRLVRLKKVKKKVVTKEIHPKKDQSEKIIERIPKPAFASLPDISEEIARLAADDMQVTASQESNTSNSLYF
jgi:hypothetical protein